jgi:hypothetical protein
MQNAISGPSYVWLELGDERKLPNHLKHAACFDYAYDGQPLRHPTQMALDHHSIHEQPVPTSQ